MWGAYVPVFTSLSNTSAIGTTTNTPPIDSASSTAADPVELSDSKPLETEELPLLSHTSRHWHLWIASAVIAALVIVFVAASALRPRKFEPWSGLSTVVPLTTFSGESYQPAISPNGMLTAFIWNNEGSGFNVYVMQPGGKPLRITSSTSSDFHPAWSPDGSSLAFLRVSPSEAKVMQIAFPGGQEHTLFTLKGGRPWSEDQLGLHSDTGPAWTPDGKELIVSDLSASGRGTGLYECNMRTHVLRALTDPSGDERDLSPAVSPDARWIAFARFSSYDSADLYILARSNSEVRQLTSEHRDVMGLTWQNDSQSLIFSSNRDRAYTLWSLELHQANPVAIAATGESTIQPVTSPGGSFMEYVDFASRSNILKVNLKEHGDHIAFEKIAPSTLRSHSAQFSPDGKSIYFDSNRDGNMRLWKMTPDGLRSTPVCQFSVTDAHFSPDGNTLLFTKAGDGLGRCRFRAGSRRKWPGLNTAASVGFGP